MNFENFITIIAIILGGGGVSAGIQAIINYHKAKAESDRITVETEHIAVQTDIMGIDYINKKLQEITEQSQHEANELRKHNAELNQKINELSNELQTIMVWIIQDNQNYRSWLETKIKQLDPNVVFPECTQPPKIFQSTNNEQK